MNRLHFSIGACHPCAGAMLIFSSTGSGNMYNATTLQAEAVTRENNAPLDHHVSSRHANALHPVINRCFFEKSIFKYRISKFRFTHIRFPKIRFSIIRFPKFRFLKSRFSNLPPGLPWASPKNSTGLRPFGVSDHLLVVVFLIPRCECRDPPSDIYSPNLLCIVPLLWNAKDLTVAAARYLYCFYNYISLSLFSFSFGPIRDGPEPTVLVYKSCNSKKLCFLKVLESKGFSF